MTPCGRGFFIILNQRKQIWKRLLTKQRNSMYKKTKQILSIYQDGSKTMPVDNVNNFSMVALDIAAALERERKRFIDLTQYEQDTIGDSYHQLAASYYDEKLEEAISWLRKVAQRHADRVT